MVVHVLLAQEHVLVTCLLYLLEWSKWDELSHRFEDVCAKERYYCKPLGHWFSALDGLAREAEMS